MITYPRSHISPPYSNYPGRLWYQESWQWHLTPWRQEDPPILWAPDTDTVHCKVMRDASDSDTVTTPRPSLALSRVTHWAASGHTPHTCGDCPVSTPLLPRLPATAWLRPACSTGRAGQGLVCHWPQTRGRAPHSSLTTRQCSDHQWSLHPGCCHTSLSRHS